jgi:TIR domain
MLVAVSQHWTASQACKWELEQATRLNKRIAPVLLEPVSAHDMPKELARINWFDIPADRSIETVADALAAALTSDIV